MSDVRENLLRYIRWGGDAVHIDPQTILVVLVAVVTFLLSAYFLFRIFDFRLAGGCPWRRVREQNRAPFATWRCKTCDVEAYTTDARPPKECKRILKTSL